nr:hypothetical protein HmN_000766300 [Hymenolepis microstoma]
MIRAGVNEGLNRSDEKAPLLVLFFLQNSSQRVTTSGGDGEGGVFGSVVLGCQRPYHVESTGSRPITEVKLRRAGIAIGILPYFPKFTIRSSEVYRQLSALTQAAELNSCSKCHHNRQPPVACALQLPVMGESD